MTSVRLVLRCREFTVVATACSIRCSGWSGTPFLDISVVRRTTSLLSCWISSIPPALTYYRGQLGGAVRVTNVFMWWRRNCRRVDVAGAGDIGTRGWGTV